MFKRRSTFNKNDTHSREGKRHTIDHGVNQRCNLIMDFMKDAYLECKKEYSDFDMASAMSQTCIIEHMKRIDPSYSRLDIVYTLQKLEKEGFLVRSKGMGKERGWVWYSLRYNPNEVKIRFCQAA